MTPKIFACLSLIADKLRAGQQVVVFSALHQPLDAIAGRLKQAGVSFGLMDGRISPIKRANLSALFKAKKLQVILCGIESCAEGHNWPQASALILLCYSWGMDKMLQCIDRVWRLNSQQDVDIYALITEGSIDETMATMLQEKKDSANMVLDGDFLEEDPTEVNLAELLQNAESSFAQVDGGQAIEESELEAQWPALRDALSVAAGRWGLPRVMPALPRRQEMEPAHSMVADLPLWRQAA